MGKARHEVSSRSGSQVRLKGLSLLALGNVRGAQVWVSAAQGSLCLPWQYTVDNDEHATLSCSHPSPPSWIQKGVLVDVHIAPPAAVIGVPASPTFGGSSATPPKKRRGASKVPTAHPTKTRAAVLGEVGAVSRKPSEPGQFCAYLFADYSGAGGPGRHKGIVPAIAVGRGAPVLIEGIYSRERLVDLFFEILQAAHDAGGRVICGVDHQYGVPLDFGKELQLPIQDWRAALRDLHLRMTKSAAVFPEDQGMAAASLSSGLQRLYFWSATGGVRLGIPTTDPRKGSRSTIRLTEERLRNGSPKRFNRISDNGSVGGQTLLGLPRLLQLLEKCLALGIRVAVWPFDATTLGDLLVGSHHAVVELYPTAVRDEDVEQSDEEDALAAVAHLQKHDLSGTLSAAMDLSSLSGTDLARARFEGWILE